MIRRVTGSGAAHRPPHREGAATCWRGRSAWSGQSITWIAGAPRLTACCPDRPEAALPLRFDAFDRALVGQSAEVTLDEARRVFRGAVEASRWRPPSTHATRVRISVESRDNLPVPGISRATISSTLGEGGRPAAPSLAGRYTCRVHRCPRRRPWGCPCAGCRSRSTRRPQRRQGRAEGARAAVRLCSAPARHLVRDDRAEHLRAAGDQDRRALDFVTAIAGASERSPSGAFLIDCRCSSPARRASSLGKGRGARLIRFCIENPALILPSRLDHPQAATRSVTPVDAP